VALPWVKVHVSLKRNLKFRRLTPPARFTFLMALLQAQDCDQNGILAVRGGPALSIDEIREDTGLGRSQQQRCLDELVSATLLSRTMDGAYIVERFDEKQADSPGAVRQRRYRVRQQVMEHHANVTLLPSQSDASVTPDGAETPSRRDPSPRNPSPRDKEAETDTEGTSLRSVPAKKRREPTETEKAGWALRDAVARVIEPDLTAINVTQWKKSNARVARELAEVGVKPEQVIEWYRRFGFVMLDQLRNAVNRETAKGRRSGDPYSSEHIPRFDPGKHL